MNLLSHISVGLESGCLFSGSSAQNLTTCIRMLAALCFSLKLGVLCQVQWGYWQNPVPRGCKREDPFVLLAVSQGLPSAPKGHFKASPVGNIVRLRSWKSARENALRSIMRRPTWCNVNNGVITTLPFCQTVEPKQRNDYAIMFIDLPALKGEGFYRLWTPGGGNLGVISQFWASFVAQMVKNLPAVQETQGSIPGSGRFLREGNGNPLQYSCLENPMNRGTGWLQSMESQRDVGDWATNTFTVSMQFRSPSTALRAVPFNGLQPACL